MLLCAGDWHVSLFYTVRAVMQYNEQQLAALTGPQVKVEMRASLQPQFARGPVAYAPDMQDGLKRLAKGMVMKRLYLADADPQSDGPRMAEALRLKAGAALLAAQSFAAAEVSCGCTKRGGRIGGSHYIVGTWTSVLHELLMQY
jgi:hypothetical protein